MQVTTARFILFRFYNIIIGRFGWGDRFLRWVLTHLLIKKKSDRDTYCQASAFFSYDQLKEK